MGVERTPSLIKKSQDTRSNVAAEKGSLTKNIKVLSEHLDGLKKKLEIEHAYLDNHDAKNKHLFKAMQAKVTPIHTRLHIIAANNERGVLMGKIAKLKAEIGDFKRAVREREVEREMLTT